MLESQINLLVCIRERELLLLGMRGNVAKSPLSLLMLHTWCYAAGYITVLICFPIIIQSAYMYASSYNIPAAQTSLSSRGYIFILQNTVRKPFTIQADCIPATFRNEGR